MKFVKLQYLCIDKVQDIKNDSLWITFDVMGITDCDNVVVFDEEEKFNTQAPLAIGITVAIIGLIIVIGIIGSLYNRRKKSLQSRATFSGISG